MIRGGTVVNHDKAEVADVLVQDGKIVAVGQDLELPQVCSVMFVLTALFTMILREQQWLTPLTSLWCREGLTPAPTSIGARMVTRWTSLMIGLQAPKLLFLVRIYFASSVCFGESSCKVLLSDISESWIFHIVYFQVVPLPWSTWWCLREVRTKIRPPSQVDEHLDGHLHIHDHVASTFNFWTSW